MASEEYLGTDAMHELLAAWSDVFAAMFRNECREQIGKKNEMASRGRLFYLFPNFFQSFLNFSCIF